MVRQFKAKGRTILKRLFTLNGLIRLVYNTLVLLRLEKLARNWHDVLSINCWYSSTFRQHFVKVILHLILHLHFTPPFYTSFLHLYFYPIFTSSLYLFKLIFGPFSKPLYVHLKFMHYCFIYCLTLSSKNYVSLLITANCITVKFDALIAELNKNVTVKFKPLEIMYHEINAWNKKTDLFILSSLLTLVLEFIDGNHALETGALLLHRDACEVH